MITHMYQYYVLLNRYGALGTGRVPVVFLILNTANRTVFLIENNSIL
jgi:hypothetical protein